MGQSVLSEIVQQLDDYGCWCSFNHIINPLEQVATPIDKFDQACQVLHSGYQCGKIDYENLPESERHVHWHQLTCDPSTHAYTSGLLLEDIYMIGMYGDPVDNLKQTCRRVNADDSCAEAACLVEGNFILTLFKIWTEAFYDVSVDPALSLNGGFDREVHCPMRLKAPKLPAGSVSNDKKSKVDPFQGEDEEHSMMVPQNSPPPQFFCCGEYPNVAPYKQSHDSSRGCCGTKSYSLTMECCDVGNGEHKAQPVCD